jgi:hypothetical protein
MSKKLLILAIVATFSQATLAGDITYVGGGRYTCSGGGCGEFNAAQASRNSISEKLDDLRTEDQIRRMRELSQINAERLAEGKAPIDANRRTLTPEESDEEMRKFGEQIAARNKAREECERESLGTFGACDHLESK